MALKKVTISSIDWNLSIDVKLTSNMVIIEGKVIGAGLAMDKVLSGDYMTV